ncbi:hypothetical protein DVT68_02555 [Dyella solisilvae]|uniref:Uncharacterized protein n=1 Tax=Dyella solisilvae TaxID=1920168 RepID=A0A370KAQ5_9GAMM|nr:hypothetical protein DVT68_02555 [Dyella solisilvae]
MSTWHVIDRRRPAKRSELTSRLPYLQFATRMPPQLRLQQIDLTPQAEVLIQCGTQRIDQQHMLPLA